MCVCVAETTYFVHIFHVLMLFHFQLSYTEVGFCNIALAVRTHWRIPATATIWLGISSFCFQCFPNHLPQIHDWESHGCYYMVVRRVKINGDGGLRTISMMQAPRSVPWFSPTKLMIIIAGVFMAQDVWNNCSLSPALKKKPHVYSMLRLNRLMDRLYK